MTADEFWEFSHRPENENRFLDLTRGRVVERKRPTRKQGVVAANVGFRLHQFVENVGVGHATLACGITLGPTRDTVRAVDAAYFAGQAVPDDRMKWDSPPPQVAVIVRGSDDRLGESTKTIDDFLDHGTPCVWLVDYEDRTVTVYRPDRHFSILKSTDELAGGGELPGFTCRVADFFRLPGQPSPS